MNSIVARYDADAADYARYWGPVLERTARRLVEHVDDFVVRRAGRLRVLEVGDAPLKLLRNVRGLKLVPLEDANQCCGFGGTFAVKNADTSTAMLADKMRNIANTRAEVCTAGDNSCLMHIGGGLHRLQTGVRTVHLAEILASTEAGASTHTEAGASTRMEGSS